MPSLSDYLGRVYNGNVPCFQFVADVLRDRGILLPAYDYAPAEQAEALRVHITQHCVPVEQPETYDVVLLLLGGVPSHIGVMSDAVDFYHHARGCGVIRQSVTDVQWRRRIAGYFRPVVSEPAA